jgi:uroporphyrinogen-III synthase
VKGPLDDQRIVVTRAAHQSAELTRLLAERGAQVLHCPVIAIGPPSDPEPLRAAAAQPDSYDWIVFTSANAVRAFTAEIPAGPRACRALIAAVGSATAKAAEAAGFVVTLVPEEYISDALVDAFRLEDLRGRRVLIPSAAVARDLVPGELRKLGAEVIVVEAYRNVIPPDTAERVAQIFQAPYPDWITFASPSAAQHLVQLAGVDRITRSKIASIGPITSAAVRALGLPLAAEAPAQSIVSLVEELSRLTLARTPEQI